MPIINEGRLMNTSTVIETKTFKLLMFAFVFVASMLLTNKTEAASSPYLWNNSGNNVFVTQSPGSNSGTLVKNGTAMNTVCYRDANWTYGNARTNRYFYGKVYSSAGYFNAWVNATYVMNQKSVPRC